MIGGAGPRLYTIPPDRPFLATLAEGLVAAAGGDPLRLPRMTVLLPTRRAVRSLREAFLRLTGEGSDPGAPLLLPRMRPIGDLDADEFEVADDETLAVPPRIPDLRRRLLLTLLVLEWSECDGEQTLLPGQAATLAGALARLLDAAATEGASFADLAKLVPLDLAEHWQVVLRFLDILPRKWPEILEAEGTLDPAERRNRLLARQAEAWRRAPPRDPIIAAGLTGGIPALVELIGVVAGLEHGVVILPGLDRQAAPETWSAIAVDPAHPQYLLAGLLTELGLRADDVHDWAPVGERQQRLRLVSEALQPTNLTDSWRALRPEPPEVLAGISRYDCASPQQEAMTIALLLRRKLEEPGATAALVTPDRELARRVAAEMRRWKIDIDDSAGLPLARTPPNAFLRLVLDLAASELAPVPLLAALKHPLAAGGLAPEEFRELTRRLERKIRGPRPAPGLKGLRAALDKSEIELRRFVDRLETCLGELPALLGNRDITVTKLLNAHIAAAERLAASREESGVARLWRETAGEVAAGFCHELLEAARDFPSLPGRHYPALFEALSIGAVVRPAYGRHPRLAIWGLVEARLQQTDLVVLGGLNEGTWPGPVPTDPWMSRQMREEFGIAVPERAIGIAAHDFAQALGAPEVALTRAARQEGVPTVPSRWLLRLDAVLRAAGLEGQLRPEPEILAAAAYYDQPAAHRPLPAPAPRPPLAARPRQLAVTDIETWRRDPYAIYAKHILRLRALDELDADPDRADLGIAIHKALAVFVRRHPRDLQADAEAELLAIGRDAFGALLSRPGAWAFWWPRFARIAAWFIGEERSRRPGLVDSLSEVKGELVVPAPGGPFTITAIADRLDRLVSCELSLTDYKTGAVPRKQDIAAAIAVQLPLEGAIAEAGGFGIPGAPVAALEHWKLGGADPAGVCEAASEEPGALIAQVLSAISEHIARYDNPAMPYRPVPVAKWRPRYSDYAHLERLIDSESE